MATPRNIAVLVGSLRRESFTRKIAQTLIKLAPATLDLQMVEIGGVSFYNQDLEPAPPADWLTLRDKLRAADGILFATPEYNRSVPGVLKNAIDVASRPKEKNVFNGKPGAVISVSPGSISGFGANHHLRQMLVFLNVPTMQQPEAYIGHVATMFDQNGNMTNDSTKEFLRTFIESYAKWIETILKSAPDSSLR